MWERAVESEAVVCDVADAGRDHYAPESVPVSDADDRSVAAVVHCGHERKAACHVAEAWRQVVDAGARAVGVEEDGGGCCDAYEHFTPG